VTAQVSRLQEPEDVAVGVGHRGDERAAGGRRRAGPGRPLAADVEADVDGWLTTVVARLCLDMLRTRSVRREERLADGVPEPLEPPGRGTDPEHEALLADSVGSRC
jgi:hypothetical protein